MQKFPLKMTVQIQRGDEEGLEDVENAAVNADGWQDQRKETS